MLLSRSLCIAAAAAATVATAFAQAPQAAPARAKPLDPADPTVAVPAPVYRSAFSAYRRFAEPPPADWKAANETVERIGGWRAYAREAAAAPAAASAPERARVPQPPAPAQRQ